MNLLHLSLDLDTPRFNQPRVIELTGVAAPSLQNWVKRGVIEMENANPGRGRERLYSGFDVIKIKIMAYLATMSLRADASAAFALCIAELLRQRQANGVCFDWREYFIVDGEHFANDALPPDLFPGEPLFWENWGELTSDPVSFFRERETDLALYARGRASYTAEDEIRFSASPEMLAPPVTEEEFASLAMGGVDPGPPMVLLPIGLIVNSLAVEFARGPND